MFSLKAKASGFSLSLPRLSPVCFLWLCVHDNFGALCIIVPSLLARGWIILFLGSLVSIFIHQISTKLNRVEEK